MREWALHHGHLLVVLDALIHGIILSLVVAIWAIWFKFLKAVKSHPNCTPGVVRVVWCMSLLLAYMTYCAAASFWWCACHYAQWWR
jgi:hypothetical protein